MSATDVVATWANLPNPSTGQCDLTVHISARAVQHFVEKHVANASEPWSQWLGEAACAALQAWRPSSAAPFNGLQVADRIKSEVELALKAPLVVDFRLQRRDMRNPPGWHRWHRRSLMVMPGGALAVIGHTAKGARLITVYFCKEAASRKPLQRWRAAAHRLVVRYVHLHPQTGFLPPAFDEVLELSKHRREKSITFLSLRNWGFRRIGDKDVWFRLSQSWPGTLTDDAHGPPRRRQRLSPARHKQCE